MSRRVLSLLLALVIVPAAWAGGPGPNDAGPLKLLTASWLGGAFDDEFVAAAIAPDDTILLAGNAADLSLPDVKAVVVGPAGAFDKGAAPPPADPKTKKRPRWEHPSTHGLVIRLSADGRKVLGLTRFGYGAATVRKMRLDAKGNVYLLGNAAQPIDLGDGRNEKGTFVAVLSPDGAKLTSVIRSADAIDFGVDRNGEAVVLSAKAKLTRYAADGKAEKWVATWEAHGDNRPGAVTVSPDTGVAAVVGYGMTHTGKEPYKDPYAYGFDRDGKRLWALWNPDPKLERGTKFATPDLPANGLMADTTGRSAAAGADGKLYLGLYADGGNTVCGRDPHDPARPLDAAVLGGVFQPTAGFGFKGASQTSVVFRLDARTGQLEKGTWLSAWLDKAHANGLRVEAEAAGAKGYQYLAGNSAFGCPTKDPWYVCAEGGYQGGGFLAAFDGDFRIIQAGYFPAASVACVAARGDRVVIAGSARHYEDEAAKVEARTYRPVQAAFGGGDRDGYFAVFRAGERGK